MEIRLLGPLEVDLDGRPLPLGGQKERTLLALFAVRANELIPRDRLVDELWGSAPPKTVRAALNVYLTRLRRLVAAAGDGVALERSGSGYMLRVAAGRLDVHQLDRLLADGRRARQSGQDAVAATTFRRALDLWRGPTLVDLAYEACLQGEIARLDEIRLELIEEWSDAELTIGQDARLVPELEAGVAANPYRERLRGQLMLALYRSGRQADALRVYREGHRLLAEFGSEPSRELRRLELAMLRHDRELDYDRPLSGSARGRITATAEQHERFAAWLVQRGESESPEWEELLGYHLEQAFRHYEELGRDDVSEPLGWHAAQLHADAGRRALERSDIRTAMGLLARARSLARNVGTLGRQLAPELGESLLAGGDLVGAYAVLAEAADTATGDEELGVRTRAQLLASYARAHADPAERGPLASVAANALDVFTELGDDTGAARALAVIADAEAPRTREAARAAQLALEHAQRSADIRLQGEIRSGLVKLLVLGSASFADVQATLRAELAAAEEQGDRALSARLSLWNGHAQAARGHIPEARRLVAEARRTLRDLGFALSAAEHAVTATQIELLADNARGAEHEARAGLDALAAMGESGCAGTLAALLAEALCRQDRTGEALAFADLAATAAFPGDPIEEVDWRAARAGALSGLGRHDEAVALAREAIELSQDTDLVPCRAQALAVAASVLHRAGQRHGVTDLANQARHLCTQKGAIVSAQRLAALTSGS